MEFTDNKMTNSLLLWNVQFTIQKLIDSKFFEFADYNKRINSSVLWNLQFITQKLIDHKFWNCRLAKTKG